MMKKRIPEGRSQSLRAFTLVELLMVVTVMVLLIAGAVPALRGVLESQRITQTAGEIYDLVELARRRATSSQEYTYLCFRNVTTDDGETQLEGVIQESSGGAMSTIYGNTAIRNLMPSTRRYVWKNMGLIAWSRLAPDLAGTSITSTTPRSLYEQQDVRFQDVQTNGVATYKVILFSPQGYALYQPQETRYGGAVVYTIPTLEDPYERYIDVSFSVFRRGSPLLEAEHQAAVILNGVNGHVQVLR